MKLDNRCGSVIIRGIPVAVYIFSAPGLQGFPVVSFEAVEFYSLGIVQYRQDFFCVPTFSFNLDYPQNECYLVT